MFIRLNVNEQELTRTDDNNIIAGSKNYVHLLLNKSPEWEGLKTYFTFDTYDGGHIVLEETEDVIVPTEALAEPGLLLISVYGEKDGFRITSNALEVDVIATGYSMVGVDDAEVNQDPISYRDIIERLEILESEVKTLKGEE